MGKDSVHYYNVSRGYVICGIANPKFTTTKPEEVTCGVCNSNLIRKK
jgi:hypothetical protein